MIRSIVVYSPFLLYLSGRGSSGNCTSPIYRGKKAFSAPETKALKKAIQRTPNVIAFFSIHSFGQVKHTLMATQTHQHQTMTNWLVFRYFYIGVDKQKLNKILNISLFVRVNICFGCTKEPSRQDGSFEYPQHMFWLRNKKFNFQLRTLI